jgi:hypothetical protein
LTRSRNRKGSEKDFLKSFFDASSLQTSKLPRQEAIISHYDTKRALYHSI